MTWADFYRPRMNPRYAAHVAARYAPFFLAIAAPAPAIAVEAGAGAGFSARALRGYLPAPSAILGIERDPGMLTLAAANIKDLPLTMVVKGDVLRDPIPRADVIYAHGVLEHFDDSTIRRMVDRQRAKAPRVVHYVPTSGYAAPSFGDERLMAPAEWQRIANPTRMETFNDGQDLLLFWER